MFEKEAEEWRNSLNYEIDNDTFNNIVIPCIKFGYNKANEWHYMIDVNCEEDLHFPPEEEEKGRVLIWKVQVITEKGVWLPICYHCGSYGDLWYEINAYHVIAWKEIVLPELPKESE